MNGIRVGSWVLPPRGPQELRYDPDWVRHAQGRPLSLSLPFVFGELPLTGDKVANYFDNLLPDSATIRRRVAERFKVGGTEPFELLQAVGRDCVGAVQLLGEDEAPTELHEVRGRVLSEADVALCLRQTTSSDRLGTPECAPDECRLSLAGAQEKTALLFWRGNWMAPHGATPTTHILKLPLGLVGGRQADFSTSVDNEWLCMTLLKAFGLPVAAVSIEQFGSRRVLVVERFDRQLAADGSWIVRLPQEDFCQVVGAAPQRKYESDGGPGLMSLFAHLRQSSTPRRDARTLMAAQLLFWLLRAPDGHAKNFSVHLLPRGDFQLAPLYDVMSAWPVMGGGASQWSPHELRLAMALLGKGRHYRMQEIQRRHFNSTARKVGMADDVEDLIEDIVARVPQVVAQVESELPDGFSPRVADTILSGLLRSAKALAAMPAF
jgi:serine/threonine-protein kinase HipA